MDDLAGVTAEIRAYRQRNPTHSETTIRALFEAHHRRQWFGDLTLEQLDQALAASKTP